jgi:D-sedoheptulose 7-phosphate isomerase
MTESFVLAPGTEVTEVFAYEGYCRQLHKIMLNIAVINGEGRRLSMEEGTKRAIELIEGAKVNSGKVMIIGNGGSAAIASHQAIDLWNAAGIPAVTFNDAALLTCLSNDYGYQHVFSRAIEMFAKSPDVLVAISSSGKSANILNAVSKARERGCQTITLSGFSNEAPLLSLGYLNFYVDSRDYGPVEIIHSALIHYFTDAICAKQRGRGA